MLPSLETDFRVEHVNDKVGREMDDEHPHSVGFAPLYSRRFGPAFWVDNMWKIAPTAKRPTLGTVVSPVFVSAAAGHLIAVGQTSSSYTRPLSHLLVHRHNIGRTMQDPLLGKGRVVGIAAHSTDDVDFPETQLP